MGVVDSYACVLAPENAMGVERGRMTGGARGWGGKRGKRVSDGLSRIHFSGARESAFSESEEAKLASRRCNEIRPRKTGSKTSCCCRFLEIRRVEDDIILELASSRHAGPAPKRRILEWQIGRNLMGASTRVR